MKKKFIKCEGGNIANPLFKVLSEKLCAINSMPDTDKFSSFCGTWLNDLNARCEYQDSYLAGFKSCAAFYDENGQCFFRATYAECTNALTF